MANNNISISNLYIPILHPQSEKKEASHKKQVAQVNHQEDYVPLIVTQRVPRFTVQEIIQQINKLVYVHNQQLISLNNIYIQVRQNVNCFNIDDLQHVRGVCVRQQEKTEWPPPVVDIRLV